MIDATVTGRTTCHVRPAPHRSRVLAGHRRRGSGRAAGRLTRRRPLRASRPRTGYGEPRHDPGRRARPARGGAPATRAASIPITAGSGSYDRAQSVVVQPDGKLVVAGTGGRGGQIILARYGPGAPSMTPSATGADVLDEKGSNGETQRWPLHVVRPRPPTRPLRHWASPSRDVRVQICA